jgi:DNA ligase-associated metallophosphoesterase
MASPSAAVAGDRSPFAATLCGERVELYAERALHWAAASMLFVADVHLGKAAAFRAGGVPLPRGSTRADLDRLASLVARTGARTIVVLGDLLHARAGRVPALDAAVRRWRDAHAAVTVKLVRGNHDDRAGDPPRDWGVEIVDEPHPLPPFLACHVPCAPPTGYALCGHLHPGVLLMGTADSARLPCFVLGPRRAILPAFGSFTGLATVTRGGADRLIAIAGGRLFALPQPPPPYTLA